MKIDLWYGNKVKEVDRIDITFYPADSTYRGNMYIKDKCIGDYIANSSQELEKKFSQLTFKWE